MVFKKFVIIGLAFTLSTFCFTGELWAQGGPFDLPVDPCTDPKEPCPIDDGVYLLLAAGIGAAAFKTYKHKQRKPSFTA